LVEAIIEKCCKDIFEIGIYYSLFNLDGGGLL